MPIEILLETFNKNITNELIVIKLYIILWNINLENGFTRKRIGTRDECKNVYKGISGETTTRIRIRP